MTKEREAELRRIAGNPGSVNAHLFAALVASEILEMRRAQVMILKLLREIAKK